ncbi:MAG: hypothetical protein PHO63_05840 [Bacilli bacterium]|nr:hypothetical protein [Bacilli bacterium]MDD4808724.1 hypothetical protein [Bacilli bacterium]
MAKEKFKYSQIAIKEVAILAQMCVCYSAMIWGVIALFEKELVSIAYILLGLGLLMISYNNYKTFKRKYLSVVYSVSGVLALLIAIKLLI